MNTHAFVRVDKSAFYRFLATEPEGRYEFEKGLIVQQMTGGTMTHSRLALRAIELLKSALDATKWEVVFEWGIETSETVRFPDVVALPVGAPGSSRATTIPVLALEVLSPSTTALDLVAKPAEYTSLDTLEAYLVLSQHAAACLAWVRGSDRRFPDKPTEYGVGETIAVPALGLAIKVADLYADIALTPSETPNG